MGRKCRSLFKKKKRKKGSFKTFNQLTHRYEELLHAIKRIESVIEYKDRDKKKL